MERRTAAQLVFLRQLPAWVVPFGLAALLVAGLALHGWPGVVALCVVAAFIGWLGYLSWPALTASGRIVRVAMFAGALVLAALQAAR